MPKASLAHVSRSPRSPHILGVDNNTAPRHSEAARGTPSTQDAEVTTLSQGGLELRGNPCIGPTSHMDKNTYLANDGLGKQFAETLGRLALGELLVKVQILRLAILVVVDVVCRGAMREGRQGRRPAALAVGLERCVRHVRGHGWVSVVVREKKQQENRVGSSLFMQTTP